jgi:hypothetical protein
MGAFGRHRRVALIPGAASSRPGASSRSVRADHNARTLISARTILTFFAGVRISERAVVSRNANRDVEPGRLNETALVTKVPAAARALCPPATIGAAKSTIPGGNRTKRRTAHQCYSRLTARKYAR